MARTALLLAAALAATVCTSTVRAADYLSGSGEPQAVGECAEPRYLAKITKGFDHQVKHVPNLPDVAITDFRNIHEHRYEPGYETDSDAPIARRYCGAKVVLSDGRSRDLWYLIESRMGFAGMGDNVEFCVSGFDRWNVYNGRCRVLH
jgi:capsid protein